VSRERENATHDLVREQYLYLTTRGRKSGRSREIEIWFTHCDDRFYVIAEYATSDWVQNIRTDPAVQVRVGGKTFSAQARIISPEKDLDLTARSRNSRARNTHGARGWWWS
jgi:deazaflavin-dependent oxidoreductase (nitroreductase family)